VVTDRPCDSTMPNTVRTRPTKSERRRRAKSVLSAAKPPQPNRPSRVGVHAHPPTEAHAGGGLQGRQRSVGRRTIHRRRVVHAGRHARTHGARHPPPTTPCHRPPRFQPHRVHREAVHVAVRCEHFPARSRRAGGWDQGRAPARGGRGAAAGRVLARPPQRRPVPPRVGPQPLQSAVPHSDTRWGRSRPHIAHQSMRCDPPRATFPCTRPSG
jgi:hypothetical protein